MDCESRPFESGQQLDVLGYAICANALGAEDVKKLMADLTRHASDRLSRQGSDYAARNLLAAVPAARWLATSGILAAIARSILGRPAFPVRGILFDKVPQANWHVGWHQDTMIPVAERRDVPGFGPWSVKAGILHVKPSAEVLANMLALRLHLDPCEIQNGPLRVVPGSHRAGFLSSEEVKQWVSTREAVTC